MKKLSIFLGTENFFVKNDLGEVIFGDMVFNKHAYGIFF